jgi:tetratricopeptide (TPR) repeat protein
LRQRDWVSVGFGCAAVAVSVFAVGSAFRWTQALVAALVAFALGAQTPSRRTFSRVSPVLVPLAVAAGLTVLSLVPLPAALREFLDPVGSGLRDDGATLMDLAPWPALSRDVPGSLRGLVILVILLGVGFTTLRFTASERGRYVVLASIAGMCTLVGVVVGVHTVLGTHRLYGFYDIHAAPNVIGPLLNENHLGSLMALGTCVALALAVYPRQRATNRVAWMVAVLVCGATTATSHSRGALIAVMVGLFVVVGVLLAQRFTRTAPAQQNRHRFATISLPVGVVAACVVVLVIYSSAGSVTDELSRTTLGEMQRPRSKFAAWKSAETLVSESPWVGVGRGGFEPSFTRVNPASGQLTYAYLENEYLQAIVDWGIPGALAIGAAMLWFAGVTIRRWRDGPLAAGALGALTAVAAQSNVDFGVELLGLAIPVTIVAATLAYVPIREATGRTLGRARAVRVAICFALVAGAALLLSDKTKTLKEDHDDLVAGVSRAEVRSSLGRHPLDYLGYAAASRLANKGGAGSSIQLLNHAMRLHPTHPGMHRVAGQWLLHAGRPNQAAIEYADALRSTSDPEQLIEEITKIFPKELAAEAIPIDYTNVETVLQTLRELHRDDVATLWLGRILKLHPRDARACGLLYESSLKRGDVQAALVAGRDCVELLPDQQTRLSLANLVLQKHFYEEAIHLVADVAHWHGLADVKSSAWLILCDAHIGLEHWDEATSCLHHLDVAGDLAPEHRDELVKRLESIRTRRAGSGASGSATSGSSD